MNAVFSSVLCALILELCAPACLAGNSAVPSDAKSDIVTAAPDKSESTPPPTAPRIPSASPAPAKSDDGDLASDPLAEDAMIPATAHPTKPADLEQEKAELASLLQAAAKAEAGSTDNATTIAALKAEISRMQSLLAVSPSGGSPEEPVAASKAPAAAPASKDADKDSDNDASTDEAAAELAQAQAMADAALAAQPLTAAAQTYSTGEAATEAATSGGRHYGIDSLTHPSLGPDANDPKHHTMGSLF